MFLQVGRPRIGQANLNILPNAINAIAKERLREDLARLWAVESICHGAPFAPLRGPRQAAREAAVRRA